MILIGNKIDRESERQVTYEEGESYANKFDMLFFETSAKTSAGIERTFQESAGKVMEKIDSKLIDPNDGSDNGVSLGTVG